MIQPPVVRLSLIIILTATLNSSIPLPGFTEESSRPTSPKVTIPAGSRIVLRSEEPVGTRSHSAGNRITLHMARDLHLRNGIILTRAKARATVIRSHRRRRLTFVDRPELHLRVDELVFPDALAVAVTSRIVRIDRLPLQAREHGIVKLEGNRPRTYLSGMINGTLFGGPLGAAIGTGAGLLMNRQRDLLLHEGTYFEIELLEALELPSSVGGGDQEKDQFEILHTAFAVFLQGRRRSLHRPGHGPGSHRPGSR